jgi:hypothetical protein
MAKYKKKLPRVNAAVFVSRVIGAKKITLVVD